MEGRNEISTQPEYEKAVKGFTDGNKAKIRAIRKPK